jgi:anti-sigma-K factor RskA
MRHNESFEDLAALAALNALDGEDERRFEAHLAEGCPICEEIVAGLRPVAAGLAANAPSVAPSPELRGRILESLDVPGARVLPIRKRSGSGLAWALAAAASLALVAIALDDAGLRRERQELSRSQSETAAKLSSAERALARRELQARVLENEDVQLLLLKGQGPQPEARARVFWSEKAKRGIILAGNLQALPADKQYELWVFDQGKPVAAGVFDVDAKGNALFESPDLSAIAAAQNFAVTVEPRGGVTAPTGPIVLAGTPAA